VLRYAQAVIASIQSMEAELAQYATGAKGNIHIAASLSAVVQFLPEDIAIFKRAFPDIDIEIEEQMSANVLRSVRAGDIDFGICNTVPGIEDLERLPYRTDRLVLMVPAGHRLESAMTVRLSDFVVERFVGLGSDAALTQLLRQQAHMLDTQLDVKIRVGSLDALCRMVHVQLGVAVVPQQIGELYVNSLNVRLVPIAEPWALRSLVMVCQHRDRLSVPAAALVNFLSNKR
jgi:DNA-binding transcriptional LysR family regulator